MKNKLITLLVAALATICMAEKSFCGGGFFEGVPSEKSVYEKDRDKVIGRCIQDVRKTAKKFSVINARSAMENTKLQLSNQVSKVDKDGVIEEEPTYYEYIDCNAIFFGLKFKCLVFKIENGSTTKEEKTLSENDIKEIFSVVSEKDLDYMFGRRKPWN